ncbi:ATP-binding protein [Streptomyces sp. NPDC052101]|uniref:ATP-binding protein n=1 Tax=Streptomyces sp. NPDC052101 TaxID=3155763 RepID=UPI00343D7694
MTAEPQTVGEGRRLARLSCTAWGFDQETAETAALLMSELVTNAVRHGRSRSIRVITSRPTPDRVRVAVVDKLRRIPEMSTPGLEDIGSRGLVLVDGLSDRWGTDLLPWGKRVWAELVIKDAAQ